MFRPNQNCVIETSDGNDVFGMSMPSTKHKERCSVVSLDIREEKSSVRADTSASRGSALEAQTDSKFLLTKTTVADIGDVILYLDMEFRIVGRFPRHDVSGKLDHYEVVCAYWGKR
jgi:hypothetical protein